MDKIAGAVKVELWSEEVTEINKLIDRDTAKPVREGKDFWNESEKVYDCPTCGNRIYRDYVFCHRCGQRLDHTNVEL